MSILIKGIDLPKASNEDCVAVIRSNGKVEVWQTGMKEFEAQAIQIPAPHGRLIDGDKIETEAKETLYGEVNYEEIANAPTILEAEEE